MKTLHSALCISISAFLITACSTTPADPNAPKPVRYGNSVKVAAYDSIQRAPSDNIQVFNHPSEIKRPYHNIALLTRQANVADEALIIKALVWKAQQIGATGLILGSASETGVNFSAWGNDRFTFGGVSRAQPIFRATAIAFDN